MAKSDSQDSSSDSSKKVAKAAKAGATPSSNVGRERRPVGFQLAFLGIVVLGTALVAFAWQERDVAALQPTFNDHWHLPYGIWDCTAGDGGAFQGPIADPGFATHSGIHTHSDGVVHLHPFSSTATGNNAQLGVFLEATNASFDGDDALNFTDRPSLSEGVQCGGEEAVLQVVSFAPNGGQVTDVITDDLSSFRFTGDQDGFVIALAPEGAEIPPPPADALQSARDSSPNIFNTFDSNLLDSELNDAGIGFNEDDILVDANEEPILDPDSGEPITRDSILEAQEELPSHDADTDGDG